MNLGSDLFAFGPRHEKTKQLTGRRPVERLGNVHHVGDDRLNAITLAFDLGDEARHLVSSDKRDM